MIPATVLKPIDYNIFGKIKQQQKPREFSFNEYINRFSYAEAMEIGYVPTILYEYAYIYAYRDMRNMMKRHRLSEFKRHSREIERIVDDNHAVFEVESSRHSVDLLEDIMKRFRGRYLADRANLLGAIRAKLDETHPDCPYPELYMYAHAARLYIEQGHRMQRQSDRLIEERTGVPTTPYLNNWATLVLALLTDICDRYPIDTSGEIARLMGIVTYRIRQFARKLK